jgi:glyoxylase-like metal-dependent hydrolase (beta-lactamase superfamily II)
MNKITITNNLIQYQFPPFEGQHFGFNIYAFINNNTAMLLDTAFEQHAKQVKQDLDEQGITVTHILFSHFHPDHTSGLPVFDNPVLYGSRHYRPSVEKYTPQNKQDLFTDMNVLDEASTLAFGAFTFTFKCIQGHIDCGLFTIINNQFVHVADDLMTSNDGQPLLPSVSAPNAKHHVQSLNTLSKLSHCTFLLSHGNAIENLNDKQQAIQLRKQYLQNIADNVQPINIEQALNGCAQPFLHLEWHDYVYQ